MIREDLIGSWAQRGGGSVMHLHADGKAVCEGHTRLGQVITERGVWKFVDGRHWTINFATESEPGIEVTEYEVVSFTRSRMEVAAADFELPIVYERL